MLLLKGKASVCACFAPCTYMPLSSRASNAAERSCKGSPTSSMQCSCWSFAYPYASFAFHAPARYECAYCWISKAWGCGCAGGGEGLGEVVRWLRQERETGRQELSLSQQEAHRLRQDCVRYQREAATAQVPVAPLQRCLTASIYVP